MNLTKKVVATTKNFVVSHKTGIAVIATAVTCMVVNRTALKQHDEFLREHNLYELFYNPED